MDTWMYILADILRGVGGYYSGRATPTPGMSEQERETLLSEISAKMAGVRANRAQLASNIEESRQRTKNAEQTEWDRRVEYTGLAIELSNVYRQAGVDESANVGLMISRAEANVQEYMVNPSLFEQAEAAEYTAFIEIVATAGNNESMFRLFDNADRVTAGNLGHSSLSNQPRLAELQENIANATEALEDEEAKLVAGNLTDSTRTAVENLISQIKDEREGYRAQYRNLQGARTNRGIAEAADEAMNRYIQKVQQNYQAAMTGIPSPEEQALRSQEYTKNQVDALNSGIVNRAGETYVGLFSQALQALDARNKGDGNATNFAAQFEVSDIKVKLQAYGESLAFRILEDYNQADHAAFADRKALAKSEAAAARDRSVDIAGAVEYIGLGEDALADLDAYNKRMSDLDIDGAEADTEAAQAEHLENVNRIADAIDSPELKQLEVQYERVLARTGDALIDAHNELALEPNYERVTEAFGLRQDDPLAVGLYLKRYGVSWDRASELAEDSEMTPTQIRQQVEGEGISIGRRRSRRLARQDRVAEIETANVEAQEEPQPTEPQPTEPQPMVSQLIPTSELPEAVPSNQLEAIYGRGFPKRELTSIDTRFSQKQLDKQFADKRNKDLAEWAASDPKLRSAKGV
ncbi:MAG: hypothetical protein Unbinned2514contig1000_21 [Prokaryotic dsDNA virus sp.]|nr:MAG: hypothetical protein Unbinned2514contig1000_21 [Prokaryotic dsDNA virus sp.]